MRGPVVIEVENTAGDRSIARTVDVEGLPNGTIIDEHLRAIAHEELAKPAVYRVRVFDDGGATYRRMFMLTAGRL